MSHKKTKHELAENKIWEDKRAMQVKCSKCQHRIYFINKEAQDKILCPYCGIYTFRNKQAEFKYRAMEKILKKNREYKEYKVYGFDQISLQEMYDNEERIKEVDCDKQLVIMEEQ